MELDLIYTKDDMIVAKQHQDWRVWQDRFDEYKTSLAFQSLDEFTDFLKTEYRLSGLDKGKLENDINQTNSDLLIFMLPRDKLGSVNVKELKVDISH